MFELQYNRKNSFILKHKVSSLYSFRLLKHSFILCADQSLTPYVTLIFYSTHIKREYKHAFNFKTSQNITFLLFRLKTLMFLDEPSKHDLTVETAGVAGLVRYYYLFILPIYLFVFLFCCWTVIIFDRTRYKSDFQFSQLNWLVRSDFNFLWFLKVNWELKLVYNWTENWRWELKFVKKWTELKLTESWNIFKNELRLEFTDFFGVCILISFKL